jgi:hypothetical protein
MSTAVQDLIQDALYELGVYQPGETMTTDDSGLGQRFLSRLVDSLQAEKIAIMGLKNPTVTMTGAASYAITAGASGPIIKIKSARVVAANGLEQPVEIVSAETWEQIRDKTRAGLFASFLYCDYGWSNSTGQAATIYLTPKPSAGTLSLITYEQLLNISAMLLSDTIKLPPGYERPVVHLLAKELALTYGKPINFGGLDVLAAEAKATLKALQAEIMGQPEPPAAVPSTRSVAGTVEPPATTPTPRAA